MRDSTPLCPLGRPALRSLTLGPSPLRGEGGPRDRLSSNSARSLRYVPPLHEVERGPGGEASKGRPPQRARSFLILLLILLLPTPACRKGADKKAAANAAPQPIVLGPEDTAVVARGPVQSGPALTGTLAAERQASVRAQIAGSILTVT